MDDRKRHALGILAGLTFAGALLMTSCANFRKLGRDLKLIDDQYRISGVIENADAQGCPVRAMVVEWDQATNEVFSGDRIELTTGGAFMFMVRSPRNQHVAAYADKNRDGKYTSGEPLWFPVNPDGKLAAVSLGTAQRAVNVSGKLATSRQLPAELMRAVSQAAAKTGGEPVLTRQGVRFALGEIARLEDPRFAATRGGDGLWTPATFAIDSGFGIYFLETYDPAKTPVLFVHGAAGSPQDWRKAMEKLDKKHYQAWFYLYPSGMRLDNAASALNDGVKLLQRRFAFRRMHVVAHSMGGLVARSFILRNTLDDGQNYISTFITFSSPWDGHEAAAMGVKFAPKIVPSWYDMKHGSDFLTHLYDRRLKGRVAHHLFYSHHAGRSPMLPAENDGTVSVSSQLRPEAREDAVEVRGFDEDHLSILSSPAALKAGEAVLDAAAP